MRYTSPNPSEVEKSITKQFASIAVTKDPYEVFYESIDLAEKLTIVRREKESIELLSPYIKQHPKEATNEDLAWLYLNYATANQYDNNPNVAEFYFKKAIELSHNSNIESVEHFIYHHYGRFLVEKGEYDLGKRYFDKALAIRQKLNDKRITSTINALDSLNAIIQNKIPR